MKKKTRKQSICLTCGKKFTHPYAYRESKYCCQKCWNNRNPKINIQCAYCGKSIWVFVSKIARTKYCSRKCYALDQRLRQKNENSHFWRGGKTKESQKIRSMAQYNEWRIAVFTRDNYQCQSCGKRSGNGKKIILNAHHIVPFSENEALRFDVDNGITLCRECHILEHPHLIKEIAADRLRQGVLELF